MRQERISEKAFGFRLPAELASKLDRLAEQTKCSRSVMMRELLCRKNWQNLRIPPSKISERTFHFWLPAGLASELDKFAEQKKCTRSAMIRELLRLAIGD